MTHANAEFLEQLYNKYKNYTMLDRDGYMRNVGLAQTMAAVPGCVIECGVWKGGSSAGMAEVLGPDREYFLFDSFQGHVDPQPLDGPAAFAWQGTRLALGTSTTPSWVLRLPTL